MKPIRYKIFEQMASKIWKISTLCLIIDLYKYDNAHNTCFPIMNDIKYNSKDR